MKKILTRCVLILMLALTAVSCTTTNHEIALSQNKPVKGKNGIKRPDWVLYDMSTDRKLYATGYGKGHSFEISLQKAKLDADSNLAIWISTSMDVMRERIVEENSTEEFSTYLDNFTSKAAQASTSLLTGVVEVDFWEDNEGGVWVLRCIDKANIKTQIQSVIDSVCKESVSAGSDPAVEQKVADEFKSALEELFAAEK